jgi:hypothetical protein
MKAFSSLRQRNAFFCVALLIAFAAFTADILDLREELGILSCPYSSLDNNVTAVIANDTTFKAEPVLFECSVHRNSSVKISFLHLLPHGFRAPPCWS